jgi:FtsH-binding integral membrane protein
MSNVYSLERDIPVADLGVDARSRFITQTYTHLLGAILGFALIEVYLFKTGLAYTLARAMLGVSWLLVLGGFIVVGWLATHMAHSARSMGAQYGGLAAYVVAQSIIFAPILVIAESMASGLIENAAAVTLVGFAGLTFVAFQTRKDFSFLGGILRWGGIAALLLIAAGALFGFQLGTFFTVAMIALAGGAILYDTSNVLHHYPPDRYVGASLELFASVAMLFWYVLRLFMSRED